MSVRGDLGTRSDLAKMACRTLATLDPAAHVGLRFTAGILPLRRRPLPFALSIITFVPVAVGVIIRFARIPLIQNRTEYPRSVFR